MAAPPSNKSPIATRASPNSRSSEIANPVRRSFTGNPFAKPSIVANSETPPPRRSSMGRETVVTFSEDKENGKDSSWKQIRVRSPAAAKNFMSPTISAASKINASPRKKILTERNEPVRTSSSSSSEFKIKSVSFAPVPVEYSDHKEEVGPTTPPVVVVSKPPKPSEAMVGPPEPVCENASEEQPDCVNLDPSFKISPPATASFSGSGHRVIAPLDADPSAPPPYDPKTNYLSPRPQFLHYRPNPRVEYYLSKDGEGKRLEESFSDTEETRSDYSPKEVEDVTSPAEVVKEEEEEEEAKEEEVPVSEPMPTIISPSTKSMPKEEEAVEVEESSKLRFSWRSKFTALIMVLAVALFAVLAVEVNVQVWSASSVSFVSELISNIRGAKNLGPLQYYNLTLMEDARVNEYSVFDQCHKEMEEMGEFDVFGNVMGSVFEVEASEEKGLQEIGGAEYEEPIDQEAGLAEIGAAEYAEPIYQEAEVPQIECLEQNQPEIGVNDVEEHVEQGNEQVENIEALEEEMRLSVIRATENLVEVHTDPEFEEKAESTNMEEVSLEKNSYEDVEALQATQAITEENIVVDHVHSKPESIASIKEEIVSSEVLNLTAERADSMVSMVNVLGIAFLVVTLVGFTAIIYMKKRENSPSNPANYAVQPLVTEKLAASPIVPISTEHTYCPSEMSSFQTSSGYRSKGLKASDEVESQEKRARKNNRRDSMASIDSSMGSPSYGSFTTYERIPIKKGYGEEEIVTPVRRSSRITRKVTSP
ncbi:hypothetical protein RchiOBHm_Chr6g0247921 [Rosa chinensis]|uniref:Transmembrane protein n=1 Tax=Rosa chinensis TaxID=74649 RepID=A0A2P6PJX9_ROSCH|nr:uncharacterized protein LOC112169510 [Rosa chinensis]PRQ22225.1 hypothetical protein RchiOBHm_Chr6g0247921 [Rosa chinensis]